MSSMTKALLLLAAVAILGGGVFLMTWDIPAPEGRVERTLDDDRFPR